MSRLGYMVDSSWWARPSGGRKWHLPDADHNPLCGIRAVLCDAHEDGWPWDDLCDEVKCKRCQRIASSDGGTDEKEKA